MEPTSNKGLNFELQPIHHEDKPNDENSSYSSFDSSIEIPDDDVDGQRRNWVKLQLREEKRAHEMILEQEESKDENAVIDFPQQQDLTLLGQEQQEQNQEQQESAGGGDGRGDASKRNEEQSDYSLVIMDQVDQILQELLKIPDIQIPQRSLGAVPRVILQPVEWPKTAEDLRIFWDQVKLKDKYGDRFSSLTNVLLHYIDMYRIPDLRRIFNSLVQKTHNRDLSHYIHHVKTGEAVTFHISQIKNPWFAKVPKGYVHDFNILRVARAKKDLLDVLLATFESLCIHRKITNGVELGMISESQEEEEQEEEEGWFQGLKKKLPEDASVTANKVSPEGLEKLYKFFSASPPHENSTLIKCQALELFNGTNKNNYLPLSTKVLYGMKHGFEKDCHYFPLFRSMYVTIPPYKQPLFQHFAQHEKGCTLMKNSCHNVYTPTSNRKDLATNTEHFEGFFCADKALFVQNLVVDLRFEDHPTESQLAASSPFRAFAKEETLFEVLDRNSIHQSYLKTSKTTEIPRLTGYPYINETSINTANILEYKFPKAVRLLDDFFNNDYCFSIDANLALYKLELSDHIKIKLTWNGIEGHRDFVTPYLLASTLHGATEFCYKEELKKVASKATHAKNKHALTVLEQYFSAA